MASDNKSILKYSVFLLIPFICFLLLCEFMASVYLRSRIENFDLEVQGNTTYVESGYQLWQHPSNYTSWSGKTHLNNLGFKRFDDTSIIKGEGVIRIFILGGSTAFGSQAAPGTIFLKLSGQDEYSSALTISAYMEKLLQEKYPQHKFEVINAATAWSQLHQQMIFYLRMIRSLQPDLIISIDGQNDSHEIEDRFLNMWEWTEDKADKIWNNPKSRLRPLFRNSNLAYLMAMILFRQGDSIEADTNLIKRYTRFERPDNYDEIITRYNIENRVKIDTSVDEYLYNLKQFDNVLREDGVKHLQLLQPQTVMDNTKILTEGEKAVQGYMFSRLDKQYFRINFFREVERRGNILRKENGIAFWSLQNMFENERNDVYTDYCHLTPLGNRLVAQKIISKIELIFPELLHN